MGGAVLQVGYVGARGTKLFRFRDINQPSQAQITAFDSGPQCVGHISELSDWRLRRPDGELQRAPDGFPQLLLRQSIEASADSSYHALQTSLRVSSWHGLPAANFVWSHAIDTASDREDFTPNQAQPQNSTNPAGDRGNSSFDIRRRFTWNFNYEFPR